MNHYKCFGEIAESHSILVLKNHKIRATAGTLITFPFTFCYFQNNSKVTPHKIFQEKRYEYK